MGRGGRGTNNKNMSVAIATRKKETTDWQAVRAGIASLGLQSYEVGGSIRNELLGQEPNDIDVCVVATNYEELLERCKKEGTALPLEVEGQKIGVRIKTPWTPEDGVEIALARKEVSTGEGHTDFSIYTSPDVAITEDLLRRDFTCNAIAQPILENGELGEPIDPTGGQADIKAGILRAVSDRTLVEDPLRVLRGMVRMSADGLVPDKNTKEQMLLQAKNLHPDGPLSAERIWKETSKMMRHEGAADALRFMRHADKAGTLFCQTFPELAPMVNFDQESNYHDLDVDEHCFRVLDRACREDMSEAVRWAALLHDAGKPASAWRGKDGKLHYYWNKKVPESKAHEIEGQKIAHDLLERLKAPKDLEAKVEILIRNHMFGLQNSIETRAPEKTARKARELILRVGRDNIDELVDLRRCDYGGKKELTPGWDKPINLLKEVIAREKKNPIEIKDLDISGHDIQAVGFQGREIGDVLRELQKRVLQDPTKNTSEQLKRWVKQMYN